MPRGPNQHNEYSRVIDSDIYDRIPKSVLTAIIVSILSKDLDFSKVNAKLTEEWMILSKSGVVPQHPSDKLLLKYKILE